MNVLNFEKLGLSETFYLLSKRTTKAHTDIQKLRDFLWSRYNVINEELIKGHDYFRLHLSYKFMGEFLDNEGKTGHNLYEQSKNWQGKYLKNYYLDQIKEKS